jgi:hypothetical protein
MQLTPGLRLRSTVCETEVVVVRVPKSGAVLCGGAPMALLSSPRSDAGVLDPSQASGSLLSKRYHDELSGLELLCTKSGQGTLTIDGRPLAIREAKKLPSSD